MRPPRKTGYQFGTFQGVFLPSVLTILGVIMYLRLGWVLGNVGLTETLIIVCLATAITFVTGLSLAALATNMNVGGGGVYFIISRSLGLEPGAAIGLPLYLAQALGIAFYVSGFAESVVAVVPELDPKLVGVVTLVTMALLAAVSADLALKSQIVILLLIVASLASFFAGNPSGTAPGVVPETVPVPLGFWVVFAVFFPAVTGIESGIAMSGDLKRPARALPIGTIAAVLTGLCVYLAIPIFLHRTISDTNVLRTDPLVMQRVARWGELVLAGIWAASLSSAMGSLLGAPRTLQALARDRVVPAVLGRGYGRGNDPRIASVVSFGLALAGILLGDLNLIAPLLSMFFLTSYGILNLSAGLEQLIANPSWRPTFRVPTVISLGGFALCLVVMLMVSPGATLVASLVSGAIYSVMKRRSLRARWGDMRLGLLMFGARQILHRVANRKPDARTWCPNLLVFSGAPTTRWYLIELAQAISRDRNFVTLASIIPEAHWTPERAENLRVSMRDYLRQREVHAFVRIVPGDDPLSGAQDLIRAYGFGPLVPNTVLLGETEQAANILEFARLVRLVAQTHRNLLILREAALPEGTATTADGIPEADIAPPEPAKRIDVWWRGRSRNLGFMLALVFLLRQNDRWRHTELVLKRIVESADEEPGVTQEMLSFVQGARIRARTEVLLQEDRSPFQVIRQSSADADFVVLGIRRPEAEETLESYGAYYQWLLRETEPLSATLLTMATEELDFQRIFERGNP
ncbi:MAG: Na-K-Cl cotransporter [Verrucomicrobia bacterium]|nr:Na-K-Cl cotransporter [Verrucomicrobiota bacterium]